MSGAPASTHKLNSFTRKYSKDSRSQPGRLRGVGPGLCGRGLPRNPISRSSAGEVRRIPFPRTTVNKGKKKSRSYDARPFKLRLCAGTWALSDQIAPRLCEALILARHNTLTGGAFCAPAELPRRTVAVGCTKGSVVNPTPAEVSRTCWI